MTSSRREQRTKLHSTNALKRLNGEVMRLADVLGSFPNEAAANTRQVGALLFEQNVAWSIQRRYLTLETLVTIGRGPDIRLPAIAT